MISFLKSQEQTQELTEAVNAAQKAVNIAIVQYKGGMIDFNRVATLAQNLVQYQNLMAQAKGAIATGLINTYRALGGGWDYRLDPQADNAPGLNAALAQPGRAPAEVVPAPNPFAPKEDPEPLPVPVDAGAAPADAAYHPGPVGRPVELPPGLGGAWSTSGRRRQCPRSPWPMRRRELRRPQRQRPNRP